MVNILYHSFRNLSTILQIKERYAMFTEQIIETIDDNNTKALSIIHLLISALENGIDDVDVISNLEVVRDYLKSNYMIFDKQGV